MKKTYLINLTLLGLISSLNVKALEFCNQNKELIIKPNIDYFEYKLFVKGNSSPPTVSVLSSKGSTSKTIKLSWTASTDESGIIGYKVYKDGVLEATLSDVLYYKVTGLTIATQYSFTIKSFNTLGNESESSNILEVMTKSVRSSKYY